MPQGETGTHHRRKRLPRSKSTLVTMALFIVAAIGMVVFVGLVAIRVNSRRTEKATQVAVDPTMCFKVGRNSITVINLTDHDWPGGTVVLNGKYTARFPRVQRSRAHEIMYYNPAIKSG